MVIHLALLQCVNGPSTVHGREGRLARASAGDALTLAPVQPAGKAGKERHQGGVHEKADGKAQQASTAQGTVSNETRTASPKREFEG